jgi:hypothetical protein
MPRQSVSKHLAVLEMLHDLNAETINAIANRWINQYDRARVQALGPENSIGA